MQVLPSVREVGTIGIGRDIYRIAGVSSFDFLPQFIDRIRPALCKIHNDIKAHVLLDRLCIKTVNLQNPCMRKRNVLDRMAHLRCHRIFSIVRVDTYGADADAGRLFDTLLNASGQRVDLLYPHRSVAPDRNPR